LKILEINFLGDKVWLSSTMLQGFSLSLKANIVVLVCSNTGGMLKVSTAGELQPHLYSPGDFSQYETIWFFHHRAGLSDAETPHNKKYEV
jgi:hypothetical protein